jgi:hypothetical protein
VQAQLLMDQTDAAQGKLWSCNPFFYVKWVELVGEFGLINMFKECMFNSIIFLKVLGCLHIP